MAKFTDVPVFVKGEPGFAAKLNQLGTVLSEVIAHIEAEEAKPAIKAAPRKAPAKAE
jgi:hypothetical protein